MAPTPKPVPNMVPKQVSVQGSDKDIVINFDQLPSVRVVAGQVTYRIKVKGMDLYLVREETK